MESFFPVLVLLMISQLPGVNQDPVKVVGGHEPIHAKVGDDVILPCHLEPPFDVNNLTIEWRFQGLHSRENETSQDKIIHVQRSGAKDDETPDPKYQGRTSMFHDEFKKGNISLKLTNVTKEDLGNYTCLVPKLQPQVRKGNVTLKLDENGAQDNLTVTAGPDAGFICCVIAGGIGGVVGALIILTFIIIKKRVVCRRIGEQIFPRRRNNSQNEERRNDEGMEMEQVQIDGNENENENPDRRSGVSPRRRNNFRHEQRRNDEDHRGNENPEDETGPLQNQDQPNQSV